MADNTVISPGSGGDTVASDDIGGVKYQRVKIGVGPDGVATDLTFGQAARTASLPVALSSEDAALLSALIASGSSVSIADGQNIAQGTTTDAAYASTAGTAAGTLVGLLKGAFVKLAAIATALAGTLATNQAQIGGVAVAANTESSATTAVTTSTTLITTDAAGYRSFSFSLTNTWTGSVQVQFSNDNTNWVQGYFWQVSGGGSVNAATANGQFYGPMQGRYIRLRQVGTATGTITAVLELSMHTVANVQSLVKTSSNVQSTGGTATFRALGVVATAQQIKGSAGQIFHLHAMNLVGTIRYLKVYNAPAASVTVGTTTPVNTYAIFGTSALTLVFDNGKAFSNGISIAATTGYSDGDSVAPGGLDIFCNIEYI